MQDGVDRVSVVINPAAGGNRGSRRAHSLVAELVDRGCTVDLHRLEGPDQVPGLVDRLRHNGVSRLILAGGDGLVHLALPALVDSAGRPGYELSGTANGGHEPMTIGIVPFGTGNDFCRGLGLPSRQSDAVSAALSRSITAVDVIAVDYPALSGSPTIPAATVLTCGFSGRVNDRANAMRFPAGGHRYTLATVIEMMNLRAGRYRVAFDDEPEMEIELLLVAVGNTRFFGGGMAVCPDASYNDGLLDVVLVDDVSALTFARVLPGVFSGRHIKHPAVTQRRCRQLRLTAAEALWADGERLSAPTGADPVGVDQVPAPDVVLSPGSGTAAPELANEVVVRVMPGCIGVAGIPAQLP